MFEFFKRKDFVKFRKENIFERIRPQIKEIAVYKGGGGLGDLVVGAPFFKSLKAAFPEASVKYMGIIYPRFENIFKSINYIDGYIHYQRPDKGKGMDEYFNFRKNNKGRIGLLIDTQRRWETSFWLRMLRPKYMLSAGLFLSDWPMPLLAYKKMHVIEQLFSLLGRLGLPEPEDLSCGLNIDDEFKKNALKILEGKTDKIAALLPSCGMAFKNWLPDYFAKIGDLFAKQGYTIIILGSPKEAELFKSIGDMMQTKPIIPSLTNPSFAKELLNDAAILEKCDVAVGNDSGGMHLASCLGITSATIFGPTTPRKFSPIGPNNIVFYKNFSCSPCRFKCRRSKPRECLSDITPKEVFSACMENLKKGHKNG